MSERYRYRPPPGGAGWTTRDACPLLYLAWGQRRYGRTPLDEECYGDWVYVAPKAGAPLILLNGQPHRLPAGHLLLIGPRCRTGYLDKKDAKCLIQTWVWLEPPRHEALQIPENSFQLFKLSTRQHRELESLHAACRDEVQNPDRFTAEALEILRRQLDLCLVRGPEGRQGHPLSGERMTLALRWMREHLADSAPARGLCDYLQISHSTLRRIFLSELGHGPREAALGMRLAEARRLIEKEGLSVKAAAYELGYRHPNDLSRALSRQAAS